jgi:hypothetical protein
VRSRTEFRSIARGRPDWFNYYAAPIGEGVMGSSSEVGDNFTAVVVPWRSEPMQPNANCRAQPGRPEDPTLNQRPRRAIHYRGENSPMPSAAVVHMCSSQRHPSSQRRHIARAFLGRSKLRRRRGRGILADDSEIFGSAIAD